MFTSKGLFSEIVCPYEQTCIQPGCIFTHPRRNATGESIADSGKNDLDNRNKGGQVAEMEDNIPKASNQNLHHKKAETEPPKDPLASPKKVFVSRPVSPPPLRRKAVNGNSVSVTTSPSVGTSNSSLKPQASKPTIQKSPKAVVKQPLKKEGLNPRALKTSAPATHDIRFRLLKALHDQFVRLNTELKKDANDEEEKLVLSDQALITNALDTEESATSTPSIYGNVLKNKIMVYKRMNVLQWKEERSKEMELSKAAEMPLEANAPNIKSLGPPVSTETGLSSEAELNLLHKLHTPISGLAKHGYVTAIPSVEDVEAAKTGLEAAKGWEMCDRCKSRFQVFPGRREEDGALASGGPCTYHYGKAFFPERSALDPRAKREKKFRCCNQPMGESAGCTQSPCHVFKVSEVKRMAVILNFQKTPVNMKKISDRPVCIDGEMGYTVHGMELIRLTATSWPSGNSLFDVLVRPFGEVLDLNSRYSGVWPKDMADAIPYSSTPEPEPAPNTKRRLRIVSSPAEARALLFSHLTPLTPLIGHGLENDLNASRIIHPTIIDTALLYPHKAGLPYRNGLKMLMQTHLNRHIQVVVDGKMEGHDSKEDANAAGELVRLALKKEWEKMKGEGWTVEFGIFSAPIPSSAAVGGKRSRERAELEDRELEINYG